MALTQQQQMFVDSLLACKVSQPAILAVMSAIDSPSAISEMARRLVEEYDKGTELNEQVVLRIMVDMCKEMSAEAERQGIELWEEQED